MDAKMALRVSIRCSRAAFKARSSCSRSSVASRRSSAALASKPEHRRHERSQGHFGLCLGVLMLKMPEVDGHLQLVPLIRQPKVLRLEAGIDVDKFFTESAQRTHCLPKKLLVYNTTSAREFQRMAKHSLCVGSYGGSLRWPACPQQAVEGWRLARHPSGLGGGAGW